MVAGTMKPMQYLSSRGMILIGLMGAVGCRPTQSRFPIPAISSTQRPPHAAAWATTTSPTAAVAGPRNVIFLLSDGTGPEAWTLARWVKGTSLNADRILTGAVRTYGADSIITDSAPGASAYSTGKKGVDKAIAFGAWTSPIASADVDAALAHVPLATILEGAKVSGYATGLVATSSIQHATPAAFSAHVEHRLKYDEIAEQQVYQGFDLVLGGGLQYLLPKNSTGGLRSDGKNLVSTLKELGYGFVTNRTELNAAGQSRLWGAFARDDMAYELDRPRMAPQQPSLEDMTRFAVERLAVSERGRRVGFFLFIEGSKVDFAAHANDPVGVVSELLSFDAAVGAALDFAGTNQNTQVVVVSDHGTGGITIGAASDRNYSQTDDDAVVGPLRRARLTAQALSLQIATKSAATEVRELIGNEWGIVDLPASDVAKLLDVANRGTPNQNLLARRISTRARIGWTTDGHTGADILLFAYGPDHPYGLVENTAVGLGVARFLGLDFAQLQQRLFVNAIEALANHGYSLKIDRHDSTNGQLVIEKAGRLARLPFARNHLIIEDRTEALEGIVVFAEKLNQVFAPQQAIDIVRRELP